jgi:ubiquinone/menaquinone biosynthesis C-methylase UbiE
MLAGARPPTFKEGSVNENLHSLQIMLFGRNGRVRRELRRAFIDPIAQIRRNPRNVGAWVDLIDRERKAGRLSGQAERLATSHRIERRGLVGQYLDEIADHAGSALAELANDPVREISRAIEHIVRWKTIIQCRESHAGDAPYFSYAERSMADFWERIIWPVIKDSDFTTVLELAPGHGRNTEFLRKLASVIHLVDVNQTCIDACRGRFGERKDGCTFLYHVTDGTNLPDVPDGSITFGYSWDSMVHFDKLVIRGYIREFARVLAPSGLAFLHMSDYGSIKPDSDFASNYGSRSDMSVDLLQKYTKEMGLTVRFVRQMVGWDEPGNAEPIDQLCVIEKPTQ